MKQLFCKKVFIYFAVVMAMGVITSCKSNDEHYVPYVNFKFEIDLGINNGLKVSSYSMKFPEPGFAGVIVFCEYYDSFSPIQSIYHAYDAVCTNEIDAECSLTVDDNGVIAECPCCGSKFSLLGGYPLNGPATRSLRRYQTYIAGEWLRVYNTNKY
jgi:Rieske Fe-S protein